MNKTFFVSALFLGFFSTLSFASPQFNEDQLSKFEQWNKCYNCDLSGAAIKENHSKADLTNSNLSGIYSIMGPINFSEANLTNVNLSGAFLSYANFSKANLTGAVFAGAMVDHANFYGSTGVDLKNAASTCGTISPNGTVLECK